MRECVLHLEPALTRSPPSPACDLQYLVMLRVAQSLFHMSSSGNLAVCLRATCYGAQMALLAKMGLDTYAAL